MCIQLLPTLRSEDERGGRMKKITVEMPDNIDCLIITYLQSVSLGNIYVGQKIAVNNDISDGSVVVIDTSKTDVYITGGEEE